MNRDKIKIMIHTKENRYIIFFAILPTPCQKLPTHVLTLTAVFHNQGYGDPWGYSSSLQGVLYYYYYL